tara:strand:- start:667 stop:1776 length:1110 start_codon:yes stop_codon:yes gene_type:complete
MKHNNIRDLSAFDMNVASIKHNFVKPLFDKIEKRYSLKLCVETATTDKEPVKHFFDLGSKQHNAIIDVDKKLVYSLSSKRYKLVRHKKAFGSFVEPLLAIPEISKLNNTDNIQVIDSNTGNVARREIRLKNDIPLIDKLPQDKAYKSIVMYNSIDSSVAFQYKVGLYRLICKNGMMGFDKWFNQYSKHTTNFDVDSISSGFKISFETINNQIKKYNELFDFNISRDNALAFLLVSLCSKKNKPIDAKDKKGNYTNINKRLYEYLTHLYDKYAFELGNLANSTPSNTGYTLTQVLTHYATHTNDTYTHNGVLRNTGRSDDNNLLIARRKHNTISDAYNSRIGQYIFFATTRNIDNLQDETNKVKSVIRTL